MTWTIWINFFPSHGDSTWNLASVGPVVSEKIFENTHTHTHILAHQNTTAESCSRWKNVEGGGALKAKHYIFVGRGGGGVAGLYFFFFFFFFQSSEQLAFMKMYNFLQVMVLLKNAVCSNGICWNEKKFLFLEERSPEKMSYVNAMVVVLTDKLTLLVVLLARSWVPANTLYYILVKPG